jgi:hypothetical protein
MPPLGNYIPANCQVHIGAQIGGWGNFPVATMVVPTAVPSPVTKTIGNTIEIHASPAWLAGPADEVRDTLIFEGINVIRKPALDALQNAFPGNNTTLAVYGRAYSDLEAQTAWQTGHALDAMQGAGIPLSVWGTGLRNVVMGAPNLLTFAGIFAVTPQQPGAPNQMQLPSEELYQFEWLTRTTAKNITEKLRDQWLAAQVAVMQSGQRDRLNELLRKETDAIVGYDRGSRGRAQKYNGLLAILAGSNLFTAPPGFINTAAYQCPTY